MSEGKDKYKNIYNSLNYEQGQFHVAKRCYEDVYNVMAENFTPTAVGFLIDCLFQLHNIEDAERYAVAQDCLTKPIDKGSDTGSVDVADACHNLGKNILMLVIEKGRIGLDLLEAEQLVRKAMGLNKNIYEPNISRQLLVSLFYIQYLKFKRDMMK